jgi:drug/metabolite transporter (DMT)-like permease
MLRLVRAFGMSAAFSLTAVIQLVAINAIAVLAFGERLGPVEGAGVALAIVSVALILLGPALSRS